MENGFIKFVPVRGKDEKIRKTSPTDGYIYFATDTGRIYLDKNGSRYSMGGSGSGGAGAAIYYAKTPASLVAEEGTELYLLRKEYMENSADAPTVGDMILNLIDGTFFRVKDSDEEAYICERLAVSGNGNNNLATSGVTLSLEPLESSNVINGQDVYVYFTAKSLLDSEENPYDEKMVATWSLTDSEGTTYANYTLDVYHDQRASVNIGKYLRESTTSTFQIQVKGINSGESRIAYFDVTASELKLTHSKEFNSATLYSPNNVAFTFNTIGNLAKLIKVTFDDTVVADYEPIAASANTYDVSVSSALATHGYHRVEVELFQDVNDKPGLSAGKLKFEIAVDDGGLNSLPIIWLGEYQEVYYAYDDIQIPFMVYDVQGGSGVEVTFYNAGVVLSTRTITDTEDFSIFEIIDASMETVNSYQISVGAGERRVEREITFDVIEDPNRTMEPVKQTYLNLSFSPKGRSNSEPLSRRQSWTNPITTSGTARDGIQAVFSNFNWYNNGWMMDENNQSFLRISNGASVAFPIGTTIFSNTVAGQQSHTFEFEFKIRNVQDYGNLITNITRYENDESYWAEFEKGETGFTNYDAYLQFILGAGYDDLKYSSVMKKVNLDNVACGYYNSLGSAVCGLCLGPQDAFFSNGTNTVNVNYVEDKMVNVSIVYQYGGGSADNLIYIYLDGVITGVIKSTSESAFSVANTDLVFNSSYCDIDLYSMRIYHTALNVNDIVTNYAVDYKDITTYDQNALAIENNAIGEYQFNYNNMLAYNDAHPDAPLMPYIIFDTSSCDTDILPESKATTINVGCTFVNTGLDRAYTSGELESYALKDFGLTGTAAAAVKANAVKEYYRHHCPSWTGEGVEMVVQGTSSEFYPRRNYKIKTKVKQSDGEKYAQIYLNKGPFADEYKEYQAKIADGTLVVGEEPSRQDFWYMDNYTNGTERWTLKVDYMESSGTYNAGFASLIGNAYSKHPLKDYVDAGIVSNTNLLMSEVVDKSKIRWQDYRTSLLGFPVLAFHKKSDGSHLFIGFYRMLLDKSSNEVLGFKPASDVKHTLLDKSMKKVAQCWEFSTNARNYTSYRDPWNRTELSFMPPESAIADKTGLTAKGAPVVANHFEYRYNDNEDYIDMLYDLSSTVQSASKLAELNAEFPGYNISADNLNGGRQLLVDLHYDWEKVCKWVWSTNTDSVFSQYSYNKVPVGTAVYEPNVYYVPGEGGYVLSTGNFDAEARYYAQAQETQNDGTVATVYNVVYLTDTADHLFATNKFYRLENDTYILITDNDGDTSNDMDLFDPSIDYYEADANSTYTTKCNRLIAPATSYDANTTYYTYDGTVKCPTAQTPDENGNIALAVNVAAAGEVTAENFANYYVAQDVTYNNITYTHDTKEYRAAKFFNDVDKHFDLEYLATYFIATEVFECYDSRGKNCMMASWGPLTEGGDYIWYPIFYDIDTQLGINNTGIPSFEFNVDATEAGNYSTSDSVLWNNFYKYFKNSYILWKYQHMKGKDNNGWSDKLTNPPLQSVDYLEGMYTFNPDYNKMIVCRGERPLIATNLDAYWKYITITNSKGISTGITGYLDREGKYTTDTNGTYFYALQGDRARSRQQFLTNRLEYIDSWLNQGNYARGGVNCIRGRVSANNPTETSDIWLESDDGYYAADGITKKYPFDAEYWMTLTPIRSSYVTLSDDSAAYPSAKYDGINPVKFNIDAIESGVRDSENYPEQLLYVYGMNQMSDVGQMHNLYWREFVIDGDASKLTRLNLGYDGIATYTDSDGKTQTTKWFNKKLNQPSIPSSASSTGMPLLKEVNLSNISIQAGSGTPTMDFTSCEKLENFRATGSTLTEVKFAEGVALNTLYLPSAITTLTLTEANLLTKLLQNYTAPEIQNDGSLKAEPGLFIEGMFSKAEGSNVYDSQLTSLTLNGGALGHDSYRLVKQFYTKQGANGGSLTLTNVNWSPYAKVLEGEIYNSANTYKLDNGHYGFKDYTHISEDDFNKKVGSGLVYWKVNNNAEDATVIDDAGVAMLQTFESNVNYKAAVGTNSTPEITGIIYIDNDTEYEECEDIRNGLQEAYPNLTFFFANAITKAYSARFVSIDAETGAEKLVAHKNGSSSPSVQKIAVDDNSKTFFDDPYELYNVEQEHWDFYGWSATKPDLSTDAGIEAAKASVITKAGWKNLSLASNNLPTADNDGLTYTFYAILTKSQYEYSFVDTTDETYAPEPLKITWGTAPTKAQIESIIMPYNDSIDELEWHYKFKGWTLNEKNAGLYDSATYTLVDPTKYTASKPMVFYAVYLKEKVTDTVLDGKYFDFYKVTYNDTWNSSYSRNDECYAISLKTDYAATLRGKITYPTATPAGVFTTEGKAVTEGKPIISIMLGGTGTGITHVFFDPKFSNEIRSIDYQSFGSFIKLRYVDFKAMTNLRLIGAYAFAGCNEFQGVHLYNPLVAIEDMAFNSAGFNYRDTAFDIVLGSDVQYLGQKAISNGFKHGNITIGAAGAPSQINQMGWDGTTGPAIYQSGTRSASSITVYSTTANSPLWNGWLYGTENVDLLISSASGAQIDIITTD